MSVLTESDRKALERVRHLARARAVALPAPAERRAIRHRAGLTGREFAGVLGIAPSTLSNWERDHREPRGAARDLYAKALEILSGDGTR